MPRLGLPITRMDVRIQCVTLLQRYSIGIADAINSWHLLYELFYCKNS